MNKIADLAAVIVDKYGLSQQDAERFVVTMFEVIDEALQNGEKQVKIKGLGTFKLTSISSRESVNVNTGKRIVIEGRNKISFIPETSLKDRVNQPFGQFDTVVVNEGVDFSDVEKNIAINGENSMENVPESEDTKMNDEHVSHEPETTMENIIEESGKKDTEDNEVHGFSVVGNNGAFQANALQMRSDEDVNMEIKKQSTMYISKFNKWINFILTAVIVLMAIGGAYGTYYYQKELAACNNRILELEIIIDNIHTELSRKKVVNAKADSVRTMVNTGKSDDSLSVDGAAVSDKYDVENRERVSYESKYDKDPRIRTGAYVITGISKTVTVGREQTLQSISKMQLGPGMECYIEAVNEKKDYKEGDLVKIPKLRLKRAKGKR